MAKTKFYAVTKGRETGVFTTWKDCQAQTNGFSGAEFKSYPTRELAEEAVRNGSVDVVQSTKPTSTESAQTSPSDTDYITNSISVDAACSGNPGEMEYQCVNTETGEQIFTSPLYPIGTNNIGEFLAVVDALKHLASIQDASTPVYTDSVSAIAWVRNKRIKTTLPRNEETEALFVAVDNAIDWLYSNTYQNPVLKWDTKAWGESKADFGRK